MTQQQQRSAANCPRVQFIRTKSIPLGKSLYLWLWILSRVDPRTSGVIPRIDHNRSSEELGGYILWIGHNHAAENKLMALRCSCQEYVLDEFENTGGYSDVSACRVQRAE